jgi:glycosyltransferase involved in cell wall biosynthesis
MAEMGIDISEYCPSISKYEPMPLWPKGVRSSYMLPFHMLWLLAKLTTRVPGLIGSYRADAVWLSRELLPGYFTLEGLMKRPIVFDVDDAVWLGKPFGQKAAKEVALRSETVIAGNNYIAEWFSSYAKDVVVVPTAVDTDRYTPSEGGDFGDCYVVGWIGTGANLKYLKAIEGSLNRFLKDSNDRRLLVVSDTPPQLLSIDPTQIIYVPWSRENEVRMIQNMNVGLMPLEDAPWVRGKCSFKMLQYMACGKPVVVSPVGMNVDVLDMGHLGEAATTNEEWYAALTELSRDEALSSQMGAMGRKVVTENYSTEIITRRLAAVFRRLF